MRKRCAFCFKEYESKEGVCPNCGGRKARAAVESLELPVGTILSRRYRIGMVTYQDDFETRYMAWDSVLHTRILIKEYFPSEFCTRISGQNSVIVFKDQRKEQFDAGYQAFLREAKILARCQNFAGVVSILDSFIENGTVYVVQRYIEGKTLAECLREGKTYTPEEAVALLSGVMDTLARIHRFGIIHRDIIPENILIDKNNIARITNFGNLRFATTSHSRSLSILVNKGYSPEELYRSRRDKGPYTDVYGMAAVLYRMITGKVPPDSMERRAVLEQGKKELLQPVSRYVPSVSKSVDIAILNALNEKVEDRTPNMETFLEELHSEKVKRRKNTMRRRNFFKWPLWVKVASICAVVAVVVFAVLLFTNVIGNSVALNRTIQLGDNMTRVPSIVNVTMERAKVRMEEAELLYGISGKEYSSDVEEDMILSQDTVEGSVVRKMSVIGVVVSGGVEYEEVPPVMGLEYEMALSILERKGFNVEVETDYSDSVAEGHVVSQSLEQGSKVEKGSTIRLVVSKGWNPENGTEEVDVNVPNFVGETYERTLELARQAGFLILVKERVYSDEYPRDTVTWQDPGEGGLLRKGSTITIIVSLGEETVEAIDFTYMRLEQAQDYLEEKGVEVSVSYEKSDVAQKDVIISQSPGTGTVLEKGDVVNLVVSDGMTTSVVPNVVGMDEKTAMEAIQNVRLVAETVYEKVMDEASVGKVIRQNIAQGQEIEKGSRIVLTVGVRDDTIEVSNVVGMTSQDASNLLNERGFSVKIVQVYDAANEGTVIDQSHTAGATYPKGTQIILIVSKGPEKAQVDAVCISILQYPNKTKYYIGETLDVAGLTLHVKYSDGTENDVSSGFIVNGSTQNEGINPVEVRYEGCRSAYLIRVVKQEEPKIEPTAESIMATQTEAPTETEARREALGICIAQYPDKINYIAGEALDAANLALDVYYSDDTQGVISTGFTVSGSTANVGVNIVTVSYEGYDVCYNIWVEAREETSQVETQPATEPVIVETIDYTSGTDDSEGETQGTDYAGETDNSEGETEGTVHAGETDESEDETGGTDDISESDKFKDDTSGVDHN